MIRAEPIKARPKKRAICSNADYEANLARLEALMDAAPGTPEGDELDILASLIQRYEDDRPKKRAPYRGGTSVEATKPWLTVDPPMSRRTWYRHEAKRKEQGK